MRPALPSWKTEWFFVPEEHMRAQSGSTWARVPAHALAEDPPLLN
jgi:hypothetical protein